MENRKARGWWCTLLVVMKGSSLVFVGSETPETVVLAALVGGVPRTASYAQAQACSSLCTARSGKEGDLTRPARLSCAFTLSSGIDDSVRLSDREERTRVRLV